MVGCLVRALPGAWKRSSAVVALLVSETATEQIGRLFSEHRQMHV